MVDVVDVRTICADIEEVKNNKFEGFGQTGRGIKSSSCMTTPVRTPVCA
jgi:hypothetical protein